jgi:holo-[acyl-carrier protein] synthase
MARSVMVEGPGVHSMAPPPLASRAVLLPTSSAGREVLLIVGLGSDLCSIERIQASLDRFGDRFLLRVFTETEQRKAARRPFTAAGTLAKRFAAKEAFSKAVGTGFKRGVFMKDIGVVNEPSGKPTLTLTGGAKARLDALTPPGHAIHVHLTMTDDYPWAQAFVILEARKLER